MVQTFTESVYTAVKIVYKILKEIGIDIINIMEMNNIMDKQNIDLTNMAKTFKLNITVRWDNGCTSSSISDVPCSSAQDIIDCIENDMNIAGLDEIEISGLDYNLNYLSPFEWNYKTSKPKYYDEAIEKWFNKIQKNTNKHNKQNKLSGGWLDKLRECFEYYLY